MHQGPWKRDVRGGLAHRAGGRFAAVLSLALIAVMATGGEATADDFYLHCGYDDATGTVYEELLTHYELKGGPLGYYSRDNMDFTGCPAPGPVEQVVITAAIPGGNSLILEVPALFIGGSAEADGVSEIETAIDLGAAPNKLGIWGRNIVGGDYFDISASGEVSYTTDGDADITVAPGSVSVWAITGGQGNDVVRSALGAGLAVSVGAGADDDDVRLGASSDSVFGASGADVLETGDGDDSIEGDAGRDVLRAGGGNDDLDGGLGRDTLFGGSGDDTFRVLDGTKDVVHCGDGYDVVASWNPGDVIASDCESLAGSVR